MTFTTEDKSGRTMMGDSAEQCARSLADAGADAIGGNCGDLDPSQTAVLVSYLRPAATVPILAQPNAGKPELIGEKTMFDLAPEPFAAHIAECVRAGAILVGCCCGTTPEHIRAVAEMLRR